MHELRPVQRRKRRHRWPLWILLAAIAVVAAVFIGRPIIVSEEKDYSNTRGATVVHYALDSKVLGRPLDEVAVIPPGKGPRPLLVLLHGRHDPKPWTFLIPHRTGPEALLTQPLFDGLAGLGHRAPVVVMLNGGAHSYYHDRADGKWGTELLHEAIPNAARRFHTLPGKIAIGGISMGGYGALHAAAVDPDMFCAVGGHSAAVWTDPGSSAPGAFDNAADFDANDVFAAAEAGKYNKLQVWIDGGSHDPFRDADRAFVGALRAGGATVSYHVWPGAHNGTYWGAHMAQYLRFYASALADC